MRIGFDAKRIFHNATGLGNYGRDVIRILDQYSGIENFALFNTKQSSRNNPATPEKSTVVYPKGWLWKRFPSLWRSLGQWPSIQSTGVDLYHGLSGELPLRCRKPAIPTVVTIHDLIFMSHPQYYGLFERIIYTLKAKYAVRTADHIIAISEQTKAEIIKYFGIDARKISVVYQGCHSLFKQAYSAEAKAQIKEQYKLPDQYVLYVGTLQERKNALTVLKAIHGTDYHLVLVGKPKRYAQKLYDYVERYQLHKQVTFITDANMEQLALLYQNATVFCYVSFCEGFSIPIVEALYSKVPVITTQGGCLAEAAGPDALFADPNNVVAIRNHITRLFENPEARKAIAEKGYAYAQQFSDEVVAQNLLNVYQSIT